MGYGIRQAIAIACDKITGFADAHNKTPLQNWLKSSIGLSKGTIWSESDISGFPRIMFSVVFKPNTKGQ